MKLFTHLPPAFVALAVLCSHSGASSVVEDQDDVVRVCDINSNQQEFVGKIVTIDAVYSTDSMVYSFFEDQSCQKRGMIDLGFRVPERDQSVSDFYAAKAAYCRKHKLAMCMVTAKMRVKGEIAETVGAHLAPDARYLVINLHSVLSYEFIDRR